MTIWETVGTIVVAVAPVGGWVISVERRISRLLAINDRLEKIDEKVDRLVDRLLDD
jgi:hypothetical protein